MGIILIPDFVCAFGRLMRDIVGLENYGHREVPTSSDLLVLGSENSIETYAHLSGHIHPAGVGVRELLLLDPVKGQDSSSLFDRLIADQRALAKVNALLADPRVSIEAFVCSRGWADRLLPHLQYRDAQLRTPWNHEEFLWFDDKVLLRQLALQSGHGHFFAPFEILDMDGQPVAQVMKMISIHGDCIIKASDLDGGPGKEIVLRSMSESAIRDIVQECFIGVRDVFVEPLLDLGNGRNEWSYQFELEQTGPKCVYTSMQYTHERSHYGNLLLPIDPSSAHFLMAEQLALEAWKRGFQNCRISIDGVHLMPSDVERFAGYLQQEQRDVVLEINFRRTPVTGLVDLMGQVHTSRGLLPHDRLCGALMNVRLPEQVQHWREAVRLLESTRFADTYGNMVLKGDGSQGVLLVNAPCVVHGKATVYVVAETSADAERLLYAAKNRLEGVISESGEVVSSRLALASG